MGETLEEEMGDETDQSEDPGEGSTGGAFES